MLGEAYQRHLVFFNTQAVWGGGIISGITVSLEEERAKALNAGEDAVDASVIQNTKIGLMGPLAGIGDSIDSGTVQYIFIALFLGLAQEGNPLGAILPFICFATATFIYGYLFTKMGYSMAPEMEVQLKQNDGRVYYCLELSGLWIRRGRIRETFLWLKENVIKINPAVEFADFDDPLSHLGEKKPKLGDRSLEASGK